MRIECTTEEIMELIEKTPNVPPIKISVEELSKGAEKEINKALKRFN